MKAAIIAVGSELLTPHRTDTNSLWLTQQLNELGIEVALKLAVGDDREQLTSVLRTLMDRFPLLISTGGLGPTEDDLTRECFAEVLGRPLRFVSEIQELNVRRFAARQIPMSENNRKQAMVLEGAEWLHNSRGTAPGMLLELGEQFFALLPGPPHEMREIFRKSIQPRLHERAGGARIVRRFLRATGLPESELDQRIAPIYGQYTDISTTILAAPTGHEIHLSTASTDPDAAQHRLDELSRRIEECLGADLFTTTGETLEAVIHGLLRERGETLAAAESCTGGLVSKRLTDLPGSSATFMGGVVAYDNRAKVSLLGIPEEMIARHGAVSAEVAEAMARAASMRFETTYGLGITGIAGPDGGSAEKPVGLVFVSVAGPRGVQVRRLHLPGDRQHVRAWSAQIMLDLLRRRLIETNGD